MIWVLTLIVLCENVTSERIMKIGDKISLSVHTSGKLKFMVQFLTRFPNINLRLQNMQKDMLIHSTLNKYHRHQYVDILKILDKKKKNAMKTV